MEVPLTDLQWKALRMIEGGRGTELSGENGIDRYVLCDTQYLVFLLAAVQQGHLKPPDGEFQHLSSRINTKNNNE